MKSVCQVSSVTKKDSSYRLSEVEGLFDVEASGGRFTVLPVVQARGVTQCSDSSLVDICALSR